MSFIISIFVSGYLNEMIANFNNNKPFINSEDDYPVWYTDFQHLRSQGERFIKEVEEKITYKAVIPYLRSVLFIAKKLK